MSTEDNNEVNPTPEALVHVQRMVMCPMCNGTGQVTANFCLTADGRCIPEMQMKCFRCKGAKEVDEQMFDWIEIGHQLKAIRKEKGLTLQEMSCKLGYAVSLTSQIEQGYRSNKHYIDLYKNVGT